MKQNRNWDTLLRSCEPMSVGAARRRESHHQFRRGSIWYWWCIYHDGAFFRQVSSVFLTNVSCFVFVLFQLTVRDCLYNAHAFQPQINPYAVTWGIPVKLEMIFFWPLDRWNLRILNPTGSKLVISLAHGAPSPQYQTAHPNGWGAASRLQRFMIH